MWLWLRKMHVCEEKKRGAKAERKQRCLVSFSRIGLKLRCMLHPITDTCARTHTCTVLISESTAVSKADSAAAGAAGAATGAEGAASASASSATAGAAAISAPAAASRPASVCLTPVWVL